MKKSKRIMMLYIMFFAAMFLSPAQVISEVTDAYQVRYTAQFSRGDLSLDGFLGYDVVGLKDAYYTDELGKPMLPAIQLQVALPAGMEVRSVEVVNTTQEEISGEFSLFPIQPPRRIGDQDQDIAFVQPDAEIYSSSQPYPSKLVEFIHQADLAGQGIAILQLNPVQYVPAERKLILYTSISFIIEGAAGYEYSHYLSPNISEKGRRTYEQMIKDMVVNPEEIQLQTGLMNKSTAVEGGPFVHIIITSLSYVSDFQPLVEWHTQKGVKDTVVTIDWIYANYSGSSDQQKIRNFVIDANSTWGTIYFLLGGEHETIPFEYRDYSAGSTPSDQYYSDFDDDWVHEVFVGRVTVGDTTQINTFVNKILKYEKDPPGTEYPLDALLIAIDYDEFTSNQELKEYIDSDCIPPRFNVSKVYCSNGGNHKDDVIHYLNAGQNLVNHAGPANWNMLSTCEPTGIDCEDVAWLTNYDQTCVVVTPGCHPNGMDHEDCIAECFVIYNPNRAGIAFTGNTRAGLYYQGLWNSLSNRLDMEWWAALFNRNRYNLGQTLVDAKHHFSHSTSSQKHCEWTFNLLGEPEMPIWTDEPDSFAVTCPDSLRMLCEPYTVHVEDSTTHDPVDSAYVCLWKEGEVYLTGYTDVNGDLAFDPVPATTGTMYVTVTKHNYVPHQIEVNVPYICGDANGDGIIDVADVIYEINYLFRDGSPPDPMAAGDVNCDGVENIADLVYKVNFLYRGGPSPCAPGTW